MRGWRGLVPTILAAEAAIIGLLFLGQFAAPETRRAPSAAFDIGTAVNASDPSRSIARGYESPGPEPASNSPVAAIEPTPVRATVAPPSAPTVQPAIPPALWVSAGWQAALWSTDPQIRYPWASLPVEPKRRTPERLGEIRVADTVIAASAPAAVIAPPVPGRRPRPPIAPAAVTVASSQVRAPERIQPEPGTGTVVIEGRTVACAALSERLRARFGSCAGAAEAMVGTVEINGVTVACGRLGSSLRGRFPDCGG